MTFLVEKNATTDAALSRFKPHRSSSTQLEAAYLWHNVDRQNIDMHYDKLPCESDAPDGTVLKGQLVANAHSGADG